MRPKLGINIDHIATLRQQRKTVYPDILKAVKVCEDSGADSIVAHLREDRRHIQDKDVYDLREIVKSRFNLEMSMAPEIVKIACRVKPDQVTIVPEKRQELTTEGGLDVIRFFAHIQIAVMSLRKSSIDVSLFIEPDKKQIKASFDAGVDIIEIHTGRYADSKNKESLSKNLNKIKDAVCFARSLGLTVNAGHGLDYKNTKAIAAIPGIYEFNIGYSVICEAVFLGLDKAVKNMKQLILGSK